MRKWWKSIDKVTLLVCFCILAIGMMLTISVSPFVATRIGANPNYFVSHHFIYVILALFTTIFFSYISEKQIKYLSILGSTACTILMIFVLFTGESIKGSKRWIHLFGFSLQPSELMKPFFVVLTALILSKGLKNVKYAAPLYFIISALLLLEPDFGSYVLYSLMFLSQLFLSNIPIIYFISMGAIIILVAFGVYNFVPHVRLRIDKFMHPGSGDNFQINKSLDALNNGGLFGVGPGEGIIKTVIPDAHADFIFAVLVEEFGAILASILIIMYMIIIIKNVIVILKENNHFTVLTIIGLVTQITSQTLINLGVNLNLLPTKGMTLPLISYGGSSLISVAVSVGIIVNLTKIKIKIDMAKYKNNP